MSALKLVTDATGEPITRLEAKVWLRVENDQIDEDPLIDSLVTLARVRIEEQTNRSFLTKTFDYYLDTLPTNSSGPLRIPKAPLISVTSIRGFATTENTDTGGTAMSTSGYYVDTANEFGSVSPISAFTFPVATRTINPAIIRFTAGYSTSSTGVPETAKVEIKQLVARLYEHRGDEAEIQQTLAGYQGPTDLDLPTWG